MKPENSREPPSSSQVHMGSLVETRRDHFWQRPDQQATVALQSTQNSYTKEKHSAACLARAWRSCLERAVQARNGWQAAAARARRQLPSVAAAARLLGVGDAHWPEFLLDWKDTKRPIIARVARPSWSAMLSPLANRYRRAGREQLSVNLDFGRLL